MEYPVDLLLVTLSLDWTIDENFEISLDLKGSLATNFGSQQYSVRGLYYVEGASWAQPASLDEYTTLSTSLSFYSADCIFLFRIFSFHDISLLTGAGLRFQYFDYNAVNSVLTYPSASGIYKSENLPYSGVNTPGLWDTYSLQEYLPYIAAGIKYREGICKFQALAGVAENIAYDSENRVLRNKESLGTGLGIGIIAKGEFSLFFTDNIFAGLDGGLIWLLPLSGFQTQSFYGYSSVDNAGPGPIGTIFYEQGGFEVSGGFKIGCEF
jgi:hypothetical protein